MVAAHEERQLRSDAVEVEDEELIEKADQFALLQDAIKAVTIRFMGRDLSVGKAVKMKKELGKELVESLSIEGDGQQFVLGGHVFESTSRRGGGFEIGEWNRRGLKLVE